MEDDIYRERNIVEVSTGEIKFGYLNTILTVSAIGSCIAVAAYNMKKHIGALAHIMLPGIAPVHVKGNKRKYAYNALDFMLETFYECGMKDIKDIEISMVGGANVLQREADNIGISNINSVIEYIKRKNLKIVAQDVGGLLRRSIMFDIPTGKVFFSVGDSPKKLLWQSYNSQHGKTEK